jgi:hypothetical protein
MVGVEFGNGCGFGSGLIDNGSGSSEELGRVVHE